VTLFFAKFDGSRLKIRLPGVINSRSTVSSKHFDKLDAPLRGAGLAKILLSVSFKTLDCSERKMERAGVVKVRSGVSSMYVGIQLMSSSNMVACLGVLDIRCAGVPLRGILERKVTGDGVAGTRDERPFWIVPFIPVTCNGSVIVMFSSHIVELVYVLSWEESNDKLADIMTSIFIFERVVSNIFTVPFTSSSSI